MPRLLFEEGAVDVILAALLKVRLFQRHSLTAFFKSLTLLCRCPQSVPFPISEQRTIIERPSSILVMASLELMSRDDLLQEYKGLLEIHERQCEERSELRVNNEKLLHENAKFRAENVALRTQARLLGDATVNGQVPNAIQHSFRFLDLPKELRLQIYEWLVVPGTITLRLRFDMCCQDERYPDGYVLTPTYAETQLFLVSKQVKNEALPLYLSKNLFICPAGWQSFLTTEGVDGTLKYFNYGGMTENHLRRLSIAFDVRDVPVWDIAGRAINQDDAQDAQWLAATTPERQITIHNKMIEEMLEHWDWLSENIAELLRLDLLQINFKNSYCAFGCCNLLAKAIESLIQTHWAHSPKKIDIWGVSRPHDMLFVQDALINGKVAKDGTEICFRFQDELTRKVKVWSESEVAVQECVME